MWSRSPWYFTLPTTNTINHCIHYFIDRYQSLSINNTITITNTINHYHYQSLSLSITITINHYHYQSPSLSITITTNHYHYQSQWWWWWWWWWCRPHPVREHAQDLRPPLRARPASPPTRQAAQLPPRGPSTNPRPLV